VLDLPASPGYPFSLRVTVDYALGDDGLTITTTALNTGATALPYGVGFHPWISPGARSLDDCTLQVDADGRSWARLTRGDGSTVAIWMDGAARAWQVCTGNHVSPESAQRTGVAIEPMSCIADAFRTGDMLVTLEPGESHTLVWGLALV